VYNGAFRYAIYDLSECVNLVAALVSAKVAHTFRRACAWIYGIRLRGL
jgi:hypothetical protein